MKQVINEPTRIIPNSATIIDHLYASQNAPVINKGSFDLTNSDHKSIYVTRKAKRIKFKSKTISTGSVKM